MPEKENSIVFVISAVERIIEHMSDSLWSVLLYVLIGVGIFFTLRTGFVQFRLFAHAWKRLLFSKKTSKKGITTFGSFTTALGNKVGTGNIVGIAIAITTGGPGAIFWMWMLALLGMATAFAESTLGQLYKVHGAEGRFKGGPAYYIQNALNLRWLGVIFSISLVFALGLVFNAVQTNSIANSFVEAFGFGDTRIIGLVVALIVAIVIFGGLRTISVITTYIVPVMAIVYLAMAIIIMVMNFEKIPAVLNLIFSSAFGVAPVLGGIAGFTLTQTATIGAQRGLFSNEAGMGTAPNIAATTNEKHPVVQGLVQMLSVFVDTMFVCTSTALIILLSGVYSESMGIQGAELTQNAISTQFGVIGKYLLTITLFLFAFTSILGNYAFAEDNMSFIKKGKTTKTIFRLLVLGMIFFGAVGSVPFVWKLSNFASALMTAINLVVILVLSKKVILLLKDYRQQYKKGVQDPVFDIKKYPELEKSMKNSSWK